VAAVRVGEEMRNENQRLREQAERLTRDKETTETRLADKERERVDAVADAQDDRLRLERWRLWLGLAVVYLLYLLVRLAASGDGAGTVAGLLERFSSQFSDHVAVLALLVVIPFGVDQLRGRAVIRRRR
jgi:hypothetical protein